MSTSTSVSRCPRCKSKHITEEGFSSGSVIHYKCDICNYIFVVCRTPVFTAKRFWKDIWDKIKN